MLITIIIVNLIIINILLMVFSCGQSYEDKFRKKMKKNEHLKKVAGNANVEQVIKLKDTRTIFKTHNGFKSWLFNSIDNKIIPITSDYYLTSKKSRV